MRDERVKRRWNPDEPFALTQPLEEHQERLQTQRRKRRGVFHPNRLSLAARLFYGAAAMTWFGWAVVGLVSGHMFLLLSRGGPLHFSGLAALLFCAAVLLCSAFCVLQVMDHYDRRDNEASYKTVRRWLLWGALILFVLTLLFSCNGSFGAAATPSPGKFGGWMSTASLIDGIKNPWLIKHLSPIAESLNRWLVATTIWFFVVGAVVKFLFKETHPALPPRVALSLLYFVFAPLLAAFTLNWLWYVATGDVAGRDLSASIIRPRIALALSMLIACAGAWMILLLITAMAVGRALRGEPLAGRSHSPTNEDVRD